MGFLLGGAVVYWFTGASIQAVTTGAARATEFIKDNINLDPNAEKKADIEKSKAVVKICTLYAQKGMWNIFIAIFTFALAFAFLAGIISAVRFSGSTSIFQAPNNPGYEFNAVLDSFCDPGIFSWPGYFAQEINSFAETFH